MKNVLKQKFHPARPNTAWCTDITYIWTVDEGFVYLTSIMDLYSRKIIAWDISQDLTVASVLKVVEEAKAKRPTINPVILHSDRGVQYTSERYREATTGMILSYSAKGYPYDNACIESFHSLIKREWLNKYIIENLKQAKTLVFEYIDTFYNTVRIHSHCGYVSPNQYEQSYYSIH